MLGLAPQTAGPGAGGQHQLVPAQLTLPMGSFGPQDTPLRVHGEDAVAGENLHPLVGREVRGVARRSIDRAPQRLRVGQVAGQHVGEAAGRVGEGLPRLEDTDAPVRLQARETAGTAQSGGRCADDQDGVAALGHRSSDQFLSSSRRESVIL